MSLRRDLRLKTLDDVLAELDRLEASNIQTVGKWSFYQILTHVAGALDSSISAYPRLLPGLIRKTIGPLAFRRMLAKGFMDEGSPNPDAPREREEGDAEAAMKQLRSAIARFRKHSGPVAEHPFFGTLTKEDFTTLHAYHASLHLSFAHPDDTVSRPAPQAFASAGRGARKTSRTTTTTLRASGKKAVKKAGKKAAKKSAAKPAKKAAKKRAARGGR